MSGTMAVDYPPMTHYGTTLQLNLTMTMLLPEYGIMVDSGITWAGPTMLAATGLFVRQVCEAQNKYRKLN